MSGIESRNGALVKVANVEANEAVIPARGEEIHWLEYTLEKEFYNNLTPLIN